MDANSLLHSWRCQPVLLPVLRAWIRLSALAIAACTLSLTVQLSVCNIAFASDAVLDTKIQKLELKLFQHEYSKDPVDSRLERLEKMVFGEGKSGTAEERLNNLFSAVPNLDSQPGGKNESAESASAGGATQPSGQEQARKGSSSEGAAEREAAVVDSSKYPAVTAIENKLLGKDFSEEPVSKRLERLEVKVFGHVSGIDDLSERVDRLKQHTGVDIAKQAPLGTDWADEEDDAQMPGSTGSIGSGSGADGRSFSGRDLRRDLGVPSGGITDRWTGSGSYGMTAPPRSTQPPLANNRTSEGGDDMSLPPGPGNQRYLPAPQEASQPLGLNQQVGALEQEVFGRSYVRDPLGTRLSRLETAVFPQSKPFADKSLPERVSRLLAVVPLSHPVFPQRSIAQNGSRAQKIDPDFGDLDDLNGSGGGQVQQQKSGGGGMAKIINSLGNLLTGGYPMAPNGVVTDPQTGLWLDPRTGSLIDPMTGAVVGQRIMQPGIGSGGNGFGSFGNGFAPFGSAPYGTGYGNGIHFGFGGIGRYGSGGLWP